MEIAVIIPDMHIPYHSRSAWSIVSKVIKHLSPKEVVLLGDMCDFYAINSHGRHSMLLHSLREEIDEVNKFFDEFEKLPGKKVYLEGNHEYRFERFIHQVCPQFFNVTDIKSLLRLEERGINFIPYGPRQVYNILESKLYARHEPYANTAKLSAMKSGVSMVYGHIHRIETSYSVHLFNLEQHVNFSPGWLGDLRFDKIFNYVKNHHDWQLGFAIAYVDPVKKSFYHQIIPILDDMTCVVNGHKFTSKG